jgi:hypothetical protein
MDQTRAADRILMDVGVKKPPPIFARLGFSAPSGRL